MNFYCYKIFSFLYASMVTQEKRNNFEDSFLDSTVVKEKTSILRSFWFEIHNIIVMSNLSQNE